MLETVIEERISPSSTSGSIIITDPTKEITFYPNTTTNKNNGTGNNETSNDDNDNIDNNNNNQQSSSIWMKVSIIIVAVLIMTVLIIIIIMLMDQSKSENIVPVSSSSSPPPPNNNNNNNNNNVTTTTTTTTSTNIFDGRNSNGENNNNNNTNTTSSASQYNKYYSNTSSSSSSLVPIFIDTGSQTSFIDSTTGQIWIHDQYYTNGFAINNCDMTTTTKNNNVTSSLSYFDRISCSYRLFLSGSQRIAAYNIPIRQSGNVTTTTNSSSTSINNYYYDIILYFQETYYKEMRERLFDIKIQNTIVYTQLDIYAYAQSALLRIEFNNIFVPPDSMNITIELIDVSGGPIISGIEIHESIALGSTSSSSSSSSSNSDTATSSNININNNTISITAIVIDTTTTTVSPVVTTVTSSSNTGLVTYEPGNLIVEENGLLLSKGLMSRIIAVAGQPLLYADGTLSEQVFHKEPDAAATFIDTMNPNNSGGWMYVSNSEVRDGNNPVIGASGVGAITFNHNGQPIQYGMLLQNTTANCGGGKTPWGTWISCEEYSDGIIYQIDPTNTRPSQPLTVGITNPGFFESFAYDIRNQLLPRFYFTKDDKYGELTRFTPLYPNWTDPWSMLHGNGTMEYLLLKPSNIEETNGTYEWTTNLEDGKLNAHQYFISAEGIDVHDNVLYFVSKKLKRMFLLNLDNVTYTTQSTHNGLFGGEPDQIIDISNNIVDNTHDGAVSNDDDENNLLLYFTEDGGEIAGVHARDQITGQYYTILEGPGYTDETTGLCFSPDHKHLYVAFQDNGILFDITRQDGLSFQAKIINLKYHTT